jgi:two-component system, chemotaxis family, CheB/CheR fusion protein
MSPAQKPNVNKFEHLLEYLRQSRGFDFSGYKRPSLMRRVLIRMQSVSVDDFTQYVDYLEVHPEEFAALFNTILVNVTSFFRDPPAWECLTQSALSRLLKSKGPGSPIRIWSAGCASGQEPYTIAIVFAEALGTKEFQRRVKIYATDADEEALAVARQASYTAKEVHSVPEELRDKYFDELNGRYVFKPDLRRSVIFGRHDLMQDAPMSRLDLLVCRNTLMYFNSEAQGRILARFNYALVEHGLLFVGKAEMLLVHTGLFSPVELKYRIFVKTTPAGLRERLLVFAQSNIPEPNNNVSRSVRLRELSFDTGHAAQAVVDANGILILVNQSARQLFGIEPRDIGRPFQDLELSYRPVELRSLIEQAYAENKPINVDNIERHFPSGDLRYFDVHVVPLKDNGAPLGVSIIFNDVTARQQLTQEVQRARHDAETVNEELQATNEELQSTNEELETTNEELQSTNEELETTNEELQSTNEELETMNEELQSTNEELQTINEELGQRTEELDSSNAFLESILSCLRGAIAVVDRNFNVLMWNSMAEDMWGMRFEEVKGQSLLTLDIGFPVGALKNPLLRLMSDGTEPLELIEDAINRRGRRIKCRVLLSPFRGKQKETQGAMIVMEEMGM